MAVLGFLLDWKSVKKTSWPNYGSRLKNKSSPLVTHHRYKSICSVAIGFLDPFRFNVSVF